MPSINQPCDDAEERGMNTAEAVPEASVDLWGALDFTTRFNLLGR